MRITIRIDDDLHTILKRRALEGNSTLANLVNQTIREGLRHPASKPATREVPPKTIRGTIRGTDT
jgi:hypothetical protein